MFNLNNYVDSLLELVIGEKSPSKRKEIVAAWVNTLKKHHRDLEWKRISKVLEDRIEKMQIKAEVVVSDEKAKAKLDNFFQKKNIPAEFTIEQKLLGGVKIVWDNLMIDNSVSGQLEKLRKSIQ